MSEIPEDLLYTSEHEWIRVDGNRAEVGITHHAQSELGDIVYVELPSLDDEKWNTFNNLFRRRG